MRYRKKTTADKSNKYNNGKEERWKENNEAEYMEIEEYENKIKALEKEIAYLNGELSNMQATFSWRITGGMRWLSRHTGVAKLHQKIREFRKQIKERGGLINVLIYRSKKLPYYSTIKKLVPYRIKRKMLSRYNETIVRKEEGDYLKLGKKLQSFLGEISKEQQLLLVFSGCQYIDSEGQRSVRLVNEAVKKGVKVIFAYYRWDIDEKVLPSTQDIFQLPIDYLYEHRNELFESTFTGWENKAFLIEFPHPLAMDLVDIANCSQWITIYDVIDDWEEFSKKGQAIWYNKKVEHRIAHSVDINIATAKRLKEKILEGRVDERNYYLIGNGVDANRIKKSEKTEQYNNSQGTLQIGYFGHLTEAWFDWELLKELAVRHKDWTFHIIGYGWEKSVILPENIILYGKKKPEELSKYAAFWDVAIIPFINCELTLSVNPIKIYEYLQLRLPVVVSNMPELKDYPYTRIAIGVDEFEKAILDMKDCEINGKVIDEFIEKNTWKEKMNCLMAAIQEFDFQKSYKQIFK